MPSLMLSAYMWFSITWLGSGRRVGSHCGGEGGGVDGKGWEKGDLREWMNKYCKRKKKEREMRSSARVNTRTVYLSTNRNASYLYQYKCTEILIIHIQILIHKAGQEHSHFRSSTLSRTLKREQKSTSTKCWKKERKGGEWNLQIQSPFLHSCSPLALSTLRQC